MSVKLFFQAISKLVFGVIVTGLLIFLPAGTFSFWNGWLLMAVLFLPMATAGFVMMLKNPELLKRRLDAKETQKEQGIIVKICGIMFGLAFVVAGLDFRFGWSKLHESIVGIAVVIFLLAYLLYGEVIRENMYLARTITVQEGQQVIQEGLYSVIRHPMYTATVFLFPAMPLILGSIPGFFVFLAYPVLIAKRIKHEEEFLERELQGYKEYKQKVKYRLIPFWW